MKCLTVLFLKILFQQDIFLYFEDFVNVAFSANEMGIFNIDLNNINLDGTNSEEDHPDTITIIRLLAWLIKFEIRKALKKDK